MEFQDYYKRYIKEEYTNAYSLMHTKGIYEGQRSVTDKKRVVILTRSGYTGQQKYSTIVWSGDISAKWETLRKQIPAGLNMCASGIPYWTLDIGAFFVKQGHEWHWNGDYEEGCKDLGYRELYTRWLQFGTFLPIFRSHGTDTRREVWNFGEKGEIFYDTIVKFICLRYKLLPYIYSMAAMVTLKDYTILRLLAFDFKEDRKVYDIKDEYMFGRAFLICPVTKPMYYSKNSVPLKNTDKTRMVYLPQGSDWYDFWTNKKYTGGQTIKANASIDTMPIYVKAGSIIPMVDVAQYSSASSEDKIKICIYPGCDGSFTLYQDENDNYNYEKGDYSIIEFEWNDDEKVLTIGERVGKFNGMKDTIEFNIDVKGKDTLTINYNGKKVTKKLN